MSGAVQLVAPVDPVRAVDEAIVSRRVPVSEFATFFDC